MSRPGSVPSTCSGFTTTLTEHEWMFFSTHLLFIWIQSWSLFIFKMVSTLDGVHKKPWKQTKITTRKKKQPKAHFCWLSLISWFCLLESYRNCSFVIFVYANHLTCHSIYSLWQHLLQTLQSYLPSGVLHNLWWQFKDIDPRQMVSDSYKFVCWTLCLFPLLFL